VSREIPTAGTSGEARVLPHENAVETTPPQRTETGNRSELFQTKKGFLRTKKKPKQKKKHNTTKKSNAKT
jgi:hypothetical protein